MLSSLKVGQRFQEESDCEVILIVKHAKDVARGRTCRRQPTGQAWEVHL
jgi:hypothetical protein